MLAHSVKITLRTYRARMTGSPATTRGVVPDLITTAKGIAGGLPLTAAAGRAEVMDGTRLYGHAFPAMPEHICNREATLPGPPA